MSVINTKAGVTFHLAEPPEASLRFFGAGVHLVASHDEQSLAFFLTLQEMRDLLSSLAGAIQPAAERVDELGIDDQDGPAGPTVSAS